MTDTVLNIKLKQEAKFMVNPITLTLSAILLTVFGEAPISVWFPLIEDALTNTVNMIVNLIS